MMRVLRVLFLLISLSSAMETLAQCDASFSYYTKGFGDFIFVDSSGQTYTKDIWSFGDGVVDSVSYSKGQITYKYGREGAFQVCRFVWDSIRNCRDTTCATVAWTDSCKARFTFTQKEDTVTFINTSPVGSVPIWDFGNGKTSFDNNPTHIYNTKLGAFNVCLTSLNTSQTCSDSMCKKVIIGASAKRCSAKFNLVTRRHNDFTFWPEEILPKMGYTWSMGDGATFRQSTVAYTYKPVSSDVSVDVCLETYDSVSGCRDTVCNQFVLFRDTCRAEFVYKDLGGGQIEFANTSVINSNQVGFAWNFGDSQTSFQGSPRHQYSRSGDYRVCLTMFDSTSLCSSTFCDSINVDTTSVTSCKASFSTAVAGDTATFTNLSTGASSYLWKFGDGDTSDLKNPNHVYSSSGTYSVWLIVKNSACVDSVMRQVVIRGVQCYAHYQIAVDTTQKFKVYLLNNSSRKSTHNYYWTFGDGSTSSQRNPTHRFNRFGKFEICLLIEDSSQQCVDKFCDSVGMDSLGRVYKAEGFDLEVIDNFVSVPTNDLIDYALYPNPVHRWLHIETDVTGEEGFVEIWSMHGRLVHKKRVEYSGKTDVDMAAYPNGMYVVKIFDGRGYAQTKLIKMSN